MKALIVGGGGREHALAWKLRRDDPSIDLLAAPGNPGIAELARCIPVAATDVDRLVALARTERVDLVVVGPEAPLEIGLVNVLRAANIPAFGPTKESARIESSKRFAKDLMLRAGVPTARASHHTEADSAKRAAASMGAPVVIKASGLAAGKGVVVCATLTDAEAAIDRMLRDRALGAAGSEILVEEFMAGEELSLFVVTDGERFLQMLPAQDHKRLFAGDAGPNTGGMGAYAPVSVGSAGVVDEVSTRIIAPVLAALRDARSPFTGLLYAGLMLTDEGPKVVEFNCRFGDPETQAILPLLASSLLEPILAVASGGGLHGASEFEWNSGYAVTTVMAAAGYPDSPRVGDEVRYPDPDDAVVLFHAGTARRPDGTLVTSGGRVLAATGLGATFDEAQLASVAFASAVEFTGKQFRTDIGWRELVRRARAT